MSRRAAASRKPSGRFATFRLCSFGRWHALELASHGRPGVWSRSGSTAADRAGLGPLKPVLKAMWEAEIDRLAGFAEGEVQERSR